MKQLDIDICFKQILLLYIVFYFYSLRLYTQRYEKVLKRVTYNIQHDVSDGYSCLNVYFIGLLKRSIKSSSLCECKLTFDVAIVLLQSL